MKKIFFVIALVAILSMNASGQVIKEVPSNVKSAFSKQFPKASNVKWAKENAKEWEAEFKMNGKEYSANFDLNASCLEVEFEILISEIPVAVKATLDKEFATYKIEEAVVSENKSVKLYEFDLKKDGKKTEVAIDINGKVVKTKEAKKGEEKDND